MNTNEKDTLESVIAERNALRTEVDRLKAMLFIEPWEPEQGIYFINERGEVISSKSRPMTREFGLERKDLGVAVRAAKEIRIHNRMLAYRDEFEPSYKYEEYDFYIVYDDTENKWSCCYGGGIIIGAVYMSKRVANELVEKLNRGEVVL